VKALLFERKLAKYAAAAVAGRLLPGLGAKHGPLSLTDIAQPDRPTDEWVRFLPRLAGICGSDLATIDGASSRYFEPIVAFPFVPGHEVVGDVVDPAASAGATPTTGRAVLIPVLHCATRGIDPPCEPCAAGLINRCERIAFGHLEPGLQSGFCESTGGGWSTSMVAHRSQLVSIPDTLSDEAAVLVEPTACAVHAAQMAPTGPYAVIGAGTLGLLTIAALRQRHGPAVPIIATAKYPEQRLLARAMGADTVVEPAALARAIRTSTASMMVGTRLTSGLPTIIDCVGSPASLAQALEVVAPGGTVLVVGMPGHTHLDLTSLWHRETAIRGCYAYVREDFDTAMALVSTAGLDQLLSATYPLARYTDAIAHAAQAGPRGSVKIAFDLRSEKERLHL
jgi:threonine dehydrogenase-like Zn-dependent dehydrogenase